MNVIPLQECLSDVALFSSSFFFAARLNDNCSNPLLYTFYLFIISFHCTLFVCQLLKQTDHAGFFCHSFRLSARCQQYQLIYLFIFFHFHIWVPNYSQLIKQKQIGKLLLIKTHILQPRRGSHKHKLTAGQMDKRGLMSSCQGLHMLSRV